MAKRGEARIINIVRAPMTNYYFQRFRERNAFSVRLVIRGPSAVYLPYSRKNVLRFRPDESYSRWTRRFPLRTINIYDEHRRTRATAKLFRRCRLLQDSAGSSATNINRNPPRPTFRSLITEQPSSRVSPEYTRGYVSVT